MQKEMTTFNLYHAFWREIHSLSVKADCCSKCLEVGVGTTLLRLILVNKYSGPLRRKTQWYNMLKRLILDNENGYSYNCPPETQTENATYW